MSLHAITYVWSHSQQSGTALLLLQCLAFNADDHGEGRVTVTMLAERCRVSERQAQYLLRQLELSGEVVIMRGVGRGRPSSYMIKGASGFTLSEDDPSQKMVQPIAPFSPEMVQPIAPFSPEMVQPIAPFSPEMVQSSVPPYKDKSLRKDLTSFSVLRGNVEEVVEGSIPPPAPVAPAPSSPRRPQVTPLAEDDWLLALLREYADRFSVEALNDQDWWVDVSNSFPTFPQEFVQQAFASLASWLHENGGRRPRTPKGWKQRMRFSLGWFYEKRWLRRLHG